MKVRTINGKMNVPEGHLPLMCDVCKMRIGAIGFFKPEDLVRPLNSEMFKSIHYTRKISFNSLYDRGRGRGWRDMICPVAHHPHPFGKADILEELGPKRVPIPWGYFEIGSKEIPWPQTEEECRTVILTTEERNQFLMSADMEDVIEDAVDFIEGGGLPSLKDHIISLSKEGKTQQAIADIVGTTQQKVSKILQAIKAKEEEL